MHVLQAAKNAKIYIKIRTASQYLSSLAGQPPAVQLFDLRINQWTGTLFLIYE